MAAASVQYAQDNNYVSSSLSATLTFPAAPTPGNLLTVGLTVRLGDAGAITAPAGWTQGPVVATNQYITAFYKISDGTETSTVWSWTNAGAFAAQAVEWEGYDTTVVNTASGGGSSLTTVAMTSAAVAGDLTVFILGNRNANTVVWPTSVTVGDVSASANTRLSDAYDFVSTAAQSASPTWGGGTDTVGWVTLSFPATTSAAVAVAGSVAGAGSAGGALTNWMPAAGSVDGLGHVSGSLLRTMLLDGAVTGVGAVAGTADAYHPLDGSVAGLGAVAGAVEAYHPLDGGVAGQGAVAGAVDVFHPLDGGVAGQGAVAGTILRTMLLTGAVKGTGAVSGALTTDSAPVRRDIGRPPRHDHSPPPMWRRPTGVSR